VIHLQDLAPCVIENKVLTTPDDEQLDGYAAKNIGGLEEPTLILLSLIARVGEASLIEAQVARSGRI